LTAAGSGRDPVKLKKRIFLFAARKSLDPLTSRVAGDMGMDAEIIF